MIGRCFLIAVNIGFSIFLANRGDVWWSLPHMLMAGMIITMVAVDIVERAKR